MIGMLARSVALVVLVLAGVTASAQSEAKPKLRFSFDRVPAQQLILLYYEECERKGVVFDPALNKLEALLTLKSSALTCSETRALVVDALARAGVGIETKQYYDVVRAIPLQDEREEWREVIYQPRFRDAVELSELALIGVRKGSFAHQRRGPSVPVITGGEPVPEAGQNGATITGKNVDRLIFFGPASEGKAIERLLLQLDVPVPQVEIRAGIYEYQTSDNEGSAISAAIRLFKGRFGSSIGVTSESGTSIKLDLPGFDAVLSLLDQDSRFRYVARPRVLAKDSEAVRFFAGEDVRVVGAITLDRNGSPLQSRETLSAGITLEATPRIRDEVVDLSVYLAVSNFVSAAGDPSILKRDLRSRLVMSPGAVYVVSGLQSSRSTKGQQRFFGIPVGHGSDQATAELLLLLSVVRDRAM